MKTLKHRWIAVSVTLVMTLAACSSSTLTEQIIESQEGVGNVEIDEEDGTVKIEIENEEGDVSAVFGGGDVPSGFPIPIADGGTVVAVIEQDSNSTVSLSYDSADYDTIKAFYEEWIAGSGAEVLNKFESSAPKTIAWTLEDGDDSYTVTVSEAGEETFVNLLVMKG
jgi:hypothetical protein